MYFRAVGLLLVFGSPCLLAQQPSAKAKPYRLPGTDLKQRIIWDAKCLEPEGSGLAFGGQDQQGNDGGAGTRIFHLGAWHDWPAQPESRFDLRRHSSAGFGKKSDQNVVKYVRELWYVILGQDAERSTRDSGNLAMAILSEIKIGGELLNLITRDLDDLTAREKEKPREIVKACRERNEKYQDAIRTLQEKPEMDKLHHWTVKVYDCLRLRNESLDFLTVDPQPRALAALAYDPKSKLYVMFGGDHLDYLMNDTWVFDMATKKWSQRIPKSAPPSRANHKLIANGDGTITLKGGYTYSNNTDYMGGPYIDLADGEWVYDIAKNEWKGEGKAVPPCTRVYRSGPFHPTYFLQDPKPDAKAFAKWLEDLPVNEWKKTNPPHLPQMNRDWGTAVIDPDHDIILRWAGGHSAHGGTDVLHFHLATNRWELCYPVELPLGQTYTNTEYPDGWNFNKRPWITGHTYQNYAYDAKSKLMVFTGRPKHSYLYDPVKGDWTPDRHLKPKGMDYNSCFYTLTLTPTPHGLVCWTAEGKLFYNEQETLSWTEVKPNGEKLPGAVVDNSTLAYDSKRDRLLFFVKGYGDKTGYSGEIHEMDWKSLKVRKLSPEGMKEASAIPYLCQIRYDPENDLMLVGGTMPPDAVNFRRTPAYDCAKNRWVEMKITGDDPSGKNGRNVSLGLMYDAKRKLWWAVDAKSQVFVLRLDAVKAEMEPLAK